MSNFLEVFNTVEETVQKKSVKKAGLYLGCNLSKAEWVEKEADEKAKKKAYKCLLLSFNIPIENGEIAEFEHRIFQPSTNAADINYFAAKYEGGVEVRKLNADEQINKEHQDVSIELIQLLQALGHTFAQAKSILAGMITNVELPGVFKALASGIVAKYPNGDKTLIDIKIIVMNNDKHLSSQLQISKANLRNLAYCNHISGKETKLAFNDYEMKNYMTFKYTGQNNPPKTDDVLISNSNAPAPPMPTDDDMHFTPNASGESEELF